MLRWYRNKNLIAALTVLSALLSGAAAADAAHHLPKPRAAYRAQLGHDLDGDRIPETATIRDRGYIYQVSIHFTTGKPKLRLTTYVGEGAAGLSLQTTDLDNDNNRDLVIMSATSFRPIGVWLNKGHARFQRVNASLYGVGRHTGPEYRHAQTAEVEPEGSVLNDPLPQATPAVESFGLEGSTEIIFFQPDQPPSDSALWQVPSRGPPAATRL